MSALAEFQLTTTAEERVLVATGEIDLSTADEFRSAVTTLTEGPGAVVLDLGGVTFIDSSGLAVLAHLATQASPVVLRSPSPAVVSILDLTGLAPLFATDAD